MQPLALSSFDALCLLRSDLGMLSSACTFFVQLHAVYGNILLGQHTPTRTYLESDVSVDLDCEC